MRCAFKYRLYPNRIQASAMETMLETHRRLYNNALAQRKSAYEDEDRSIKYTEQSSWLKAEREVNGYLAVTNFSSCQATLRRLDKAFQAFFRRIKAHECPGYPRFRGRNRYDTVEFPSFGDGCQIRNGRAYFQHIGEMKVKWHRPIPDEAVVKTASFKREPNGWYVVYSCMLPDVEASRDDKPSVGIDLGLKSFLVTSDGESVEPPKYYRKAQKALRRAQRSVSRKKRGDHNRRKSVRQVARLHQHVANQRRDFHHKVALSLVKTYGIVAHEDLNVRGIARTRLAKSTLDAGWSQFLGILRHKAECAGVVVVAVNPRNTTQTCSACGCLPNAPLKLSDRVYHCSFCGMSCDRDLNAAHNILTAGTRPLGANQGGCVMDCPRSPSL